MSEYIPPPGAIGGPLPPVSHTHDPATSKEAEADINKTGTRVRDIELVMGLVTAHPGHTSTELADIGHLTLYKVRRRLSDLKNQGRIFYGGKVKRGGQRAAMTWYSEP